MRADLLKELASMELLIAVVLGLVIGWLGSLASRADSQAAILLYVVAGLAGSIIGPLLFGSDYLFDVLLVAALSAMVATAIVYLARGAWARSGGGADSWLSRRRSRGGDNRDRPGRLHQEGL